MYFPFMSSFLSLRFLKFKYHVSSIHLLFPKYLINPLDCYCQLFLIIFLDRLQLIYEKAILLK